MSKFLGPAPGRDPQPPHCPVCGSHLAEGDKCIHCAQLTPPEDFSTYPRLTNCPNCHRALDEAGFCNSCASRRQGLIGLALFAEMPALGCGSCFLGGFYGPSSDVTAFLFFGGPALGVVYCVYLAFYWLFWRRRKSK